MRLCRSLEILALLLVLAVPAARACTCSQAPPGKCPGLQEDDVVFLGTVTGVEDIAYAPLGRSLLAGVVPALARLDAGDTRGRHPRFVGDNFAKNRALVERLETIAREKGCTPAQLALAWLLARGPDVIPIPGTKRITRLEENLGALRMHLTPAEIDRISAAIPI